MSLYASQPHNLIKDSETNQAILSQWIAHHIQRQVMIIVKREIYIKYIKLESVILTIFGLTIVQEICMEIF